MCVCLREAIAEKYIYIYVCIYVSCCREGGKFNHVKSVFGWSYKGVADRSRFCVRRRPRAPNLLLYTEASPRSRYVRPR